jgi:hypothetical protein
VALSFGWYFPAGIGAQRTVGAKGNVPNEEEAWAVCRGREIGSFITGRSSAYTAGDMATDPATIVESLLRDELGLADADIDMPSFIGAENASVTARLNLIDQESAYAVIRRLSEQSTFIFCFNDDGKARLIPLHDTTPTTNRTIPASHILPEQVNGLPYIEISKTGVYCNKMKIESRWQGEYDAFRDYDLVENSTSQTDYGIRESSYQWPNICGTVSDYVANTLVGNADGIWANPHTQIAFRVAGFTQSDVEVGDWIEIDDESMDGLMKCYGESWAGQQFLVVETEKTEQNMYIRGVQLW